MVHRDEADSLICGTFGQYLWHLNYVRQVLARDGCTRWRAVADDPGGRAAVHRRHPCASQPTPEQIAETVIGAARHVRRFGMEPKIALCSQRSSAISTATAAAHARGAGNPRDARMRDSPTRARCTRQRARPELRARIFPAIAPEGAANVLVFANGDAASGVRNILKMKAAGWRSGRS
jgi:malate dehydrogenase (oxaloacetate-decarboxylating)(NADP+)